MTLREVGEKFSDSFNDLKSWYLEGSGKLINGDFLDLTVGQAILFLILAFMMLGGIVDGITSAKVNRIRFKSYLGRANKGDASAQYNLGKMYADGEDCVDQDLIQAYKWYDISGRNGCVEGINSRDLIEYKMVSCQIKEAKKLADEWIEENGK